MLSRHPLPRRNGLCQLSAAHKQIPGSRRQGRMGINIVPNSLPPGQGEKMRREKAPGLSAGVGIFNMEMQSHMENGFCFKPGTWGSPNPSAWR